MCEILELGGMMPYSELRSWDDEMENLLQTQGT